jgi:hypothetical protein
MKKTPIIIFAMPLLCILTSCAGGLPTAVPLDYVDSATVLTPIPESDWEQQYIDLYGLTIALPHKWQIQEINRHPEPPNDPITGHDCAEYQISSFDNLASILLRPSCGSSEGFPNAYYPGTIVINPNSDENKICRYFTEGEYVYSIYGLHRYEDLTGYHQEPTCFSPPAVLIGGEQDFIPISISFEYLGPQEQLEKILETVDRIVLSITKP